MAERMYEEFRKQWESQGLGEKKMFEKWYADVEPKYPAEAPMTCDITIGDQLEFARLTANAVKEDQVDNARFLRPDEGSGQDLRDVLRSFLACYTQGGVVEEGEYGFNRHDDVLVFEQRCIAPLQNVEKCYERVIIPENGVNPEGEMIGIRVADPQVVRCEESSGRVRTACQNEHVPVCHHC